MVILQITCKSALRTVYIDVLVTRHMIWIGNLIY
jgi:hypothetical protein